MSAYPNLFEVLDDNGDAIAQEIDRKSKVIIKDAPATKKKEAPKKEDKKSEPVEQAADGFEVINRPPRQPKADKPSPVTQASGRGGRGRGPRGDRPPRAEGDQPRRQEGDRPPRSDRPRTDRPPRQEGEGGERPPRRERAPRQEGEGGERAPRQEGERAPRRPFQPRQEGENPRPPREPRAPRENNGDESGERRDERPRGRGGRGRGRGNYGNRGEGAPHNDLAEGAPVETEEPQRYHSHSRRHEDKLTDEKGFVQAKHRAFDRRSATGRTGDDVKRSGRGAANWGAPGEENTEAYADAVAFEAAVDNNEAAPVEAEAHQGNAAESAKPEEEKTRTLKEYRESLETELARVELPAPRKAGEDSSEKWNNNKVLRKDSNNIKLSVIAPTKEKKKGETTPTVKKAKKEVVVDLLKFKAAPREGQERRRDDRPQNDRPRRDQRDNKPRKEKAAPVAASSPAAPKNSKEEFPALVAVKN